jgi:hypothetical protein
MTELHDPYDRISELPMDLLRSIVGHRIQRVGYKTSGDPVAGLDQGSAAFVHEVDHAVVISTESAAIVLEWCIRNYDEFLNVASAPEEGVAAAVTRVVDVTSLPQWSRLQESAIASFGVATHRSEDGSELLWALRIAAANGASVVVALGELRDAMPTYQPDSLLVIFQPELAQSLQVLDSSESAWGRDLGL